jgi:hypothetical protein
MTTSTMKFQEIAAWAIQPTPDARALFETVALLNLENKWIRLSAATQRAVMGANVFGKKEFKIGTDGELMVAHSVAFGQDKEIIYYTLADIERAIVAPGLTNISN